MAVGIGIGVGLGVFKVGLAARSVIVSDSFDRTDNAASLGIAETGQAWTNNAGVMGITSNQAKRQTAVVAVSTVNAGVSDCTISVDLNVQLNAGIAFRLSDPSNYLMARIFTTDSLLQVYTIINGAATLIGSYAFTPTVGHVYNLAVQCNGPSIVVLLDGVERVNVSSTHNQTVTNHGITVRNSSANDTFDNFKVGT